MNERRSKQASLVAGMFIRALKEFKFCLDVYKDGTMVFVDNETGDGYLISADELQRVYEEMEVEE